MTDPLQLLLERSTAGRYRVLRELGRGGMGAVFLAEDRTLDRHVAIKVLPPDLAINATLRERFVREAKLAASLSHPNIIHVHAVEEQGDLLAIVMQYVDGETLSQRIARSGPYDAIDCARLLQDTAWALGYAHARGIVHRDVKPDNLMIERGTGRALIMDFGIARKEQASSLTEVGQSIGTPHYMSPEQAAAEAIDGRSDLYSLGCVGFFAATGRTVFQADSAHRLLMLHMTQPPPPVTSVRAEFPVGLTEVIARLLSKDRNARYDTAEALAEAINDLHLRTREVAPLLRLFQQQTAQSLQMGIFLAAFLVGFWNLAGYRRSLIGSVAMLLVVTVLITTITQMLDRVRFVVRQGFTAADAAAASDAIRDETSRAGELLVADPVEAIRLRRRKAIAAIGGFLSGVSIGFFPQHIARDAAGRAHVDGLGFLLLVSATVFAGVSLALWTMRPVRITLAQRLAGRFWHTGLGRALFARAERRYAADLARSRR
ncbi:MAG: serine/threonine protein kinase [Gemmatimonadaceae bacterium]|nr:serine/threonine protein kinase [Gemmatimonadaceae bacterium]MCW5825797.1 serine/threonine protein kinase [Gemmatimonadaceae bacterium]